MALFKVISLTKGSLPTQFFSTPTKTNARTHAFMPLPLTAVNCLCIWYMDTSKQDTVHRNIHLKY